MITMVCNGNVTDHYRGNGPIGRKKFAKMANRNSCIRQLYCSVPLVTSSKYVWYRPQKKVIQIDQLCETVSSTGSFYYTT